MKKCEQLSVVVALIAALFAVASSLATLHAQDSLRVIELSAPGQSAPISVPAGHVFTFSLFAPKTADSDYDAAVGVVTYAAPISYVHEHKFRAYEYSQYWFVGPAAVALRGSAAGARMQLYAMKLPAGVNAGILSAQASTYSVAVPKGSLLTSLLGFSGEASHSVTLIPPWVHHLSIQSPSGANYGVSRLDAGYGYYFRIPTPRIRGAASLHNPNSSASSVVSGFYYDDLDSVSPTADFVGPGTATFSLPPEGERSTPIAFYCYRITPANVISPDATPPVVKVTTPTNASASTTSSFYALKGKVTDNINPTGIRFRIRSPHSTAYGAWASVTLSGDLKTKGWERSVSLTRKGVWRIQIQALDSEQNTSAVQTITLTRQ